MCCIKSYNSVAKIKIPTLVQTRIHSQTVQSDTHILGVSEGSGWQVAVLLCIKKLVIPEDYPYQTKFHKERHMVMQFRMSFGLDVGRHFIKKYMYICDI